MAKRQENSPDSYGEYVDLVKAFDKENMEAL